MSGYSPCKRRYLLEELWANARAVRVLQPIELLLLLCRPDQLLAAPWVEERPDQLPCPVLLLDLLGPTATAGQGGQKQLTALSNDQQLRRHRRPRTHIGMDGRDWWQAVKRRWDCHSPLLVRQCVVQVLVFSDGLAVLIFELEREVSQDPDEGRE